MTYTAALVTRLATDRGLFDAAAADALLAAVSGHVLTVSWRPARNGRGVRVLAECIGPGCRFYCSFPGEHYRDDPRDEQDDLATALLAQADHLTRVAAAAFARWAEAA